MTRVVSELSDKTVEPKIPAPLWLCLGVNVLAFVAICALVVLRTERFWYDETWYLASVEALRQHGLSAEFLKGLPGPAGPLYASVHYLFEPITGLRPLPTRLATIFLFTLTVGALALALRASGVRFAALRAPQLLAAPMLYGTIGTALTEVPAMLAFVLHIAVLLAALHLGDRSRAAAIALGALAGICFGVAIAGRQTLLAALLALPALGWRRRPAWPVLVACFVSALILPGIIFVTWGGLAPPRTAFVGGGFSPTNVLMAFAYAGIVYSIYDFSWIFKHAWRSAAVVLAGVCLNLIFGLLEQTPLLGTAAQLLPAWSMPLYSRFASGLFLGWGLVFMTKLVTMLRQPSATERYLVLATILLLGSALNMNLPYAGRYIAGSVPLLLLLALRHTADTKWKAVRMALAAVVGLASLNAYIVHGLRLEPRPRSSGIAPNTESANELGTLAP